MENNYQLSRIHNYVSGLMSREEMHILEREALDDPFLQDAIDGYSLQHGVDAKSLSLLQQRLERRVAEHARQKSTHFYSWQRLAIGLAAGVLFIAVCMLLLIRHLPNRNSSNVTEVELMDDALTKIQIESLGSADARPVGGWDAFSAYLESKYSGRNTDRQVDVHFRISQSGIPVDVRIVGSDAEQIEPEILRLFQQGPKWNGQVGNVRITFPE